MIDGGVRVTYTIDISFGHCHKLIRSIYTPYGSDDLGEYIIEYLCGVVKILLSCVPSLLFQGVHGTSRWRQGSIQFYVSYCTIYDTKIRRPNVTGLSTFLPCSFSLDRQFTAECRARVTKYIHVHTYLQRPIQLLGQAFTTSIQREVASQVPEKAVGTMHGQKQEALDVYVCVCR